MSHERDFFADLKRKAQQRAAEEERERARQERLANARQEEVRAIEEKQRATEHDLAERLERAREALSDSGFPQLVDELIEWHDKAGLEHIGRSTDVLKSRKVGASGTNLIDKLKGEYHYDSWEMRFPFQKSQDTALIFVSWGDFFSNDKPRRGLAIEAFPDRRIVVVGRRPNPLSERQWLGNIDKQYNALMDAYNNPMQENRGPKERSQEEVWKYPWDPREKGGGAGS